MLLGNAGDFLAFFQSLRVFVTQVELFLQCVGVLVAPHGDVPREQGIPPRTMLMFITLARCSAMQPSGLVRVVVHFIAVCSAKHRCPRPSNSFQTEPEVRMIQDLVFLHGHEQNAICESMDSRSWWSRFTSAISKGCAGSLRTGCDRKFFSVIDESVTLLTMTEWPIPRSPHSWF